MAQQPKILEPEAFKFIIENTPLVSIDLCLVHKGYILLGKRNNQPLKGEWFTPGGRVFKNEPWQGCIQRVARSELGLSIRDPFCFRLMGVWDHFYEDSAMDENISTHYINLPHYLCLSERPDFSTDQQHRCVSWFELEKVAGNDDFHEYMQAYSSWLINAGIEND